MLQIDVFLIAMKISTIYPTSAGFRSLMPRPDWSPCRASAVPCCSCCSCCPRSRLASNSLVVTLIRSMTIILVGFFACFFACCFACFRGSWLAGLLGVWWGSFLWGSKIFTNVSGENIGDSGGDLGGIYITIIIAFGVLGGCFGIIIPCRSFRA